MRKVFVIIVMRWVSPVETLAPGRHASGATIVAAMQHIMEPKDQPYGDRSYGAADPGGHTWYFAQPLRVDAALTRAGS